MRSHVRFRALLATGLALAPGAAWSFVGSANLLEPKLMDAETFAEKFVAFADLSDGTFLQIEFGISNVGPGDGNGGCRFLVVEPDGTVWKDDAILDRKDWRFEKSPSPRLVLGPCEVISNTSSFTMRAPLEVGKVELTLKSPAQRIPAHDAKVGSDFYELEILVPWAAAEVTLEKSGKKKTVSGFGYADHNRSKILPAKLAKRWIRFRSLNTAGSRLVLVRFPSDRPDPVGWYREQPSTDPVVINRVKMIPGPKQDGARAWRVLLDGGSAGPWRITTTKLIYRYAPAEEHGVLGSMVAAFVGKPVNYTYRAVMEDKKKRTRVEGLLEITLVDEE